jgi:aspartate racemase
MKEIIGIVGGMGSHAAVSFFQNLICSSPVKEDQEYMELIIHNNSAIPDRTEALLYGGEDPLPELIRSVQILEKCGSSTIVLACMTAHNFYDDLQKELKTSKLFNIIEETVNHTINLYQDVSCVGIIASSGAIKTKLWQNAFNKRKIKSVILSDEQQEIYFNDVIYGQAGIKAGVITQEQKNKMIKASEILASNGAEVIIGGCSELPIIFSQKDIDLPYINAMDVAINTIINRYYNRIP